MHRLVIGLGLLVLTGGPAWGQKWEKIIDNGQPGYSETGNAWATWTVGGYNNNYRYLSHKDMGLKRVGTATWQVAAPYTGQYDVSVHFRQTVNRTPDADYNVYDGNGKRHHFSLNQKSLASGWHKLGTFSWKKGQVMKVVLDGTDDNESDEADAVRWRYSNSNPPPPPTACSPQPPGTYVLKRYARKVVASGDWKSPSHGQGAPDGQLISSPNVDKGEDITASDFQFCQPPGQVTFTQVRIGVLARMQYDSGRYQLVMALRGGGKRFTFSQTSLKWVYGDISGAKATWSLNDLNALDLVLGHHSHPGGGRDSDAWVDAFVIEATYVVSASPPTCPSGQTKCGAGCVELKSDAQHCGACDQACPAGASCVAGRCETRCPTGQVKCAGRCVELQRDAAHCGGCGRACGPGQTCQAGRCSGSSGCAAPKVDCGGVCVDIHSDVAHCGGCSQRCPPGAGCVQAACTSRGEATSEAPPASPEPLPAEPAPGDAGLAPESPGIAPPPLPDPASGQAPPRKRGCTCHSTPPTGLFVGLWLLWGLARRKERAQRTP